MKRQAAVSRTAALEALAGRWRDEARRYGTDGLPASAAVLERVAGELEAAARDWLTEPLTVKDAAGELGVSESSVYRWLAQGRLPNAGTKYRPRIRRCDLKVGRTGPDLAGQVLRAS